MIKYFIAGATSELGNRVVKLLVEVLGADHIMCLVRSTSYVKPLEDLRVEMIIGDVTDPKTYSHLLNEEIIYIDMTHPKYYHKSIDIVKKSGVKRAFFVTTTGIFSQYNQASEIYKIGENRIKESGIVYTIFRPSLIYGTDRDRNMTMLIRFLNAFPIFPVFGDGACYMQPVYVQDLAEGISAGIIKSEYTENKAYNLCGPRPIPYIEILKIICATLNKQVFLLHFPHKLAAYLAGIGEKIPGFPIKREQVLRLVEDKNFDISLAQQELDYSPRDFTEGIREEIDLLEEKGLLTR